MAAKVLSIEVCDQTIAVCRTLRKGKGVRISDAFIFRTPESCVLDGNILNPLLLGQELKKQLAQHGLHTIKSVSFVLSSSKIVLREVKLPRMKKQLIPSAIKTNVEDYFPIELQNYHIVHCILEDATPAKPFFRIKVMAVPTPILESYAQLAEQAGLSLKSITTGGDSQYQMLRQLNAKSVTAYVDISGSSTNISFLKDSQLLLQRTFAFGADELITHYMSISGKSAENYLEAMHETDVTHSSFAADRLLSLTDVQTDLGRLVNGVSRSIDYLNSSQSGLPVSRIVLVGLNRHLVGLKELVLESTAIETLYLDEIADFAELTNNAPDAPSFINCIGSAVSTLNLLPAHMLSPRKKMIDDKDTSIKSSVVITALIILAALAISLSSYVQYRLAQKELAATKDEISSLEYTQEAYDFYISYQNSQQAVDALAAEEATPNAQLVTFFKELEQKMPASILILSADCGVEDVSFNITTGSYTDAAAAISELRSFASLADVSVGDLKSEKNELGITRISFTAVCTYGTNPYLNKLNPYSSFIVPPEASADAAAGTSPSPSSDTASGTQSQP